MGSVALPVQEIAVIGPLRIARMTTAAAQTRILAARNRTAPLCVAFCNAHTAKLAFGQPRYAATLEHMLVLNDGLGIDLAARALSQGRFPENLNGTDFVPALLAASPRPLRLFLFGARPDVLLRAQTALALRFPQHVTVGSSHGYVRDDEMPAIADKIRAADADLVLCAMGNPRQEVAMARLAAQSVAPVLIGVGALFDFLADAVPRAPAVLRRMRMEFLYRLAHEPKRLGRRYTIDAAGFLIAILRLRIGGSVSSRP